MVPSLALGCFVTDRNIKGLFQNLDNFCTNIFQCSKSSYQRVIILPNHTDGKTLWQHRRKILTNECLFIISTSMGITMIITERDVWLPLVYTNRLHRHVGTPTLIGHLVVTISVIRPILRYVYFSRNGTYLKMSSLEIRRNTCSLTDKCICWGKFELSYGCIQCTIVSFITMKIHFILETGRSSAHVWVKQNWWKEEWLLPYLCWCGKIVYYIDY